MGISQFVSASPITYPPNTPPIATIGGVGLTATTVRIDTASAHTLAAGNSVTIASCVPSAYNGTWTVASTPSSTQFVFTKPSATQLTAITTQGTVTKLADGWPPTLAVSTAPNTQLGDRLVMFVIADARTSTASAGFLCPTPSGWTLLGNELAGVGGEVAASGTTGRVWSFTRRVTEDYSPPTIAPTKTSNLASEHYAAIMLAYRPSKAAFHEGGANFFVTTSRWEWDPGSVNYGSDGSTAVVLAWRTRFGGGLSGDGPLAGTSSFVNRTLRVSALGVPGRFGDLRIADMVANGNFAGAPGQRWTPSGSAPVALTWLTFDAPGPDDPIVEPTLSTGWRVRGAQIGATGTSGWS